MKHENIIVSDQYQINVSVLKLKIFLLRASYIVFSPKTTYVCIFKT